jgi:uncharacterized protein YjbI with pentapeptide repeats
MCPSMPAEPTGRLGSRWLHGPVRAQRHPRADGNLLVMATQTSRGAWGLAMLLALVVLVGSGLLFVRFRPYLVARYWGEGADLSEASLAFASLQGAQLWEANLSGADLRGADLRRAALPADLTGADLSGAHLTGAFLAGADLTEANLTGADLQNAEPTKATFRNANLTRANLAGALLGGADLRGADLASADLSRANLRGADLSTSRGLARAKLHGARYDRQTRWPAGFDPERHGAVRQ